MPIALGAALNSNTYWAFDFLKPGQAGEREALAYCKLGASFYKILELIVHWLQTATNVSIPADAGPTPQSVLRI